MNFLLLALFLFGCGSSQKSREEKVGPRLEIAAVRTSAAQYTIQFFNIDQSSTVWIYQVQNSKLQQIASFVLSLEEQTKERRFSIDTYYKEKEIVIYVTNPEGSPVLQSNPFDAKAIQNERLRLALDPYKSTIACESLLTTDMCELERHSNSISCQFSKNGHATFNFTIPAFDYRNTNICASNLSPVQRFYEEACRNGSKILFQDFSRDAKCHLLDI